MIIHLTKSELFTEPPEDRFAREYDLPPQVWTELWRRYMLLEYTYDELQEYFELKTKKKIGSKALRRWIWRTQVYCRANHVMRAGVEVVVSNFFGEYEERLIRELLKNVKNSVQAKPKILI